MSTKLRSNDSQPLHMRIDVRVLARPDCIARRICMLYRLLTRGSTWNERQLQMSCKHQTDTMRIRASVPTSTTLTMRQRIRLLQRCHFGPQRAQRPFQASLHAPARRGCARDFADGHAAHTALSFRTTACSAASPSFTPCAGAPRLRQSTLGISACALCSSLHQ